MRSARPKIAIVMLALLGLGCPIGPFSGGRLSGEVRPAHGADWSALADVENCQLETNPGAPHSINCWCAASHGKVYVPSSMILGPTVPTEREWVRNVQADPAVRLRVGASVYELTAVRVEDATEYESARSALEARYELDPAERDPEREIWIFRLEPR